MDNQQSKTYRQFWFVGFMDGEGSFLLMKQSTCKKYAPAIKVAGTDFLTLEDIKGILKENGVPFYVEVRKPKVDKHKPSWMVVVKGHKRCKAFFEAFPPVYFKTKNYEATDLYSFILSRSRKTQKEDYDTTEQVLIENLRNKSVRLAFNDYTPASMV